MSAPVSRDVTCPGCGDRVRRSGLSSHRKTQACVAATARSRLRAAGFTEGLWRDREREAFGVPTERARTRKVGNSYSGALWEPWWASFVFRNWPGAANARPHEDLLRAFVAKLRDDPETARAFKVVRETWQGSEYTDETRGMLVDFARATVGTVDADAEVREALDVLHRALVRRERALG